MKFEDERMLKLDERQTALINAVGNASRLKILLTLWKTEEELTVYKISQKTWLKRERVDYHLRKLLESKLVLRKVYGAIPLYTINKESPEVNALIDFFIKTKL